MRSPTWSTSERRSRKKSSSLLNAALTGKLLDVEYARDPVFGFEVPRSCDGVPASVLNPASSWASPEAYMQRYRELGARFIDNFHKFAEGCPPEVLEAGPKRA